MEETKATMLECKNCLKKGHTLYTKSTPFWTVVCGLVIGAASYIAYQMLVLMYEWSVGDITGETKSFVLICWIAVICIVTTIFCAAHFFRNFKRRDYWLFMDKFGRVHCDTVMPQFHDGNYSWQPLGSDVYLLAKGQTFSREQFEIASDIIHWRVGGFRRSIGRIYSYRCESKNWEINHDIVVAALLPPAYNRAHWMHAYITIKTLSNGSAITAYLCSFLSFTVKHGAVINTWLSNNDILTRIAQLLRDNEKNDTAIHNYPLLGRFLVRMREMASNWPECSEYAKAMRKETDSFLEVMPPEDVKEWREWIAKLSSTEDWCKAITAATKAKQSANSQATPPAPLPEKHPGPGDAICISMEEIARMKAAEPQPKS